MGFKVMKYHSIVHMANDIKMYGVPQEHDTGANESGHKITKVAAKLTQKNIRTFEKQTAIRLHEFTVIEWAMAELDGRRLWNYYGDYDPEDVDGDAFALIDNATTSTDNATTSTVPVHGEEDSIGSEDHFVTGGTPMEVYWIFTD